MLFASGRDVHVPSLSIGALARGNMHAIISGPIVTDRPEA
jgi:hypothetical protein